jgi:hypothetical protein
VMPSSLNSRAFCRSNVPGSISMEICSRYDGTPVSERLVPRGGASTWRVHVCSCRCVCVVYAYAFVIQDSSEQEPKQQALQWEAPWCATASRAKQTHARAKRSCAWMLGCGLLGNSSPASLVRTLVFLCCGGEGEEGVEG